jgi:hypothetical protein
MSVLMEGIYSMATLKNKIRKKHFDTQFRLKKNMEKQATYDLEYAQSYDMDEILSGNEAYQEFVNEKNSDFY